MQGYKSKLQPCLITGGCSLYGKDDKRCNITPQLHGTRQVQMSDVKLQSTSGTPAGMSRHLQVGVHILR